MKSCLCVLGLAALVATPAAARQTRAPARTPAPAPVQAPQPAPAPAQSGLAIPVRVTARALLGVCSENQGACLTYVLGAVDSYVASSVVNFGRPYLCFPPQVTNQQIANVAVAYMRAHPEAQDSNAGLVVIQGVATSFPCR
ncbi:MAG TPA: Rap1a/Tai family immunity protein [Allosphingosinicella sp.]|jgi:hypothetical protein|nr:Rap1a/Tai family immunity protein [Allosphingosinicella sp.]